MESKKTGEEYSGAEKEALLNHWFYYYRGAQMKPKDLEDFKALSQSQQDKVFNHIVTNFIFNSTMQPDMLLYSIREGKAEQLIEHTQINPERLSEENREYYENIRRIVSSDVVETYINPEPRIPLKLQQTETNAPKVYR